MNKKLTLPQIKRLAVPASGYQEYSTNSIPGLRVRVMSSGVRSYVFRYKSSGKNNVITLGRVEGVDLKDVETQARELRYQVDTGNDPATERRDTKANNLLATSREDELNPRLKDFIKNEFIPKHAKRHTKSWVETERYFNRDVLPTIGNLRIQNIKRRDVVVVLNAVQERGAYTASNRLRAVMSKAFTYAIQQGYIEANPVQYTAVMKEKARDRVLDDDDIRLLWENSDGHVSKLALRFALLSGQRGGEIVGMQWSDIRNGVWYLASTKNGHSHTVPVSAGMQSVLDGVRRLQGKKYTPTGFVFTSRKRNGDAVQRASLLAVMKSFPWSGDTPTVHDLRRTAATIVSKLGHSRTVQDKLLNHVDSSIGGIYDRNDYTPEKLKALDDLWGEVQRVVGLNVVEFPKMKAVTA